MVTSTHSHKTAAALILLASMMTIVGCVSDQKDLFDAEKTKEIYQNSFPVKDIDPSMDWKTTQNAKVSVSVNGDPGTDYKIQIFDANPLNKINDAKLLAEGYANQNLSFETTIDCPKAISTVFVARVDAKGRYLVKSTDIENNTVKVNFGDETNLTRTTRASENDIPTMECPYTDSEVRSLIENSKTKEVVNGVDLSETNKGVFKISKDFSGKLEVTGEKDNTLIITAKWIINDTPEINGAEIIIANGGEIVLNSDLIIKNRGYITVLPGGKITGKQHNIKYTNGSNGIANYNGGVIDINILEVEGSGGGNGASSAFYNYGSLLIQNYTATSGNMTLINWGQIMVNGFINGNNNTDIKNGCYIEVKGDLFCKHLVIGENAAIKCGSLKSDGSSDLDIYLEKNAMLTSLGETNLTRKITGPREGSALFKIGTISGNIYDSNAQIKNNVICEIANQESNKVKNPQWSDNSNSKWTWTMFDWLAYGLIKNGASYCNVGKADFILPAGDCTGDGYTPDTGGDDVNTKPMNYIYAFEDNYPAAGDYDFNDAVIDVTTEYGYKDGSKNKIAQIQLNVVLRAVGASKQLGAGLRLANISKSAIEEVRFEGDVNNYRNTLVNSVFENAPMENNGNECVIPLFGDAHKIYGIGGESRIFINTKIKNIENLYTLKVIIVLKDKEQSKPLITKDNLDFFIAYRTLGPRTEVHLFEFRPQGATANGTVHLQNLEIAGNLTWAICVPKFKYPAESIKITEAYPLFTQWAHDHTNFLDWYEHPTDLNDQQYVFE